MTPTTVKYELINASDDIRCMDIFVKTLGIMKDCPEQHRKAALMWMRSIIDSEIENLKPF